MNAFWQLYRKDLLNSRTTLMLFPGMVVVWLFFLLSRIGRWPADLVFGLSWAPIAMLPFLAIWTGFQAYRSEWSMNTSYLILSLPVSGARIAASKLLAVVTEMTAFGLLILAGAWIVSSRIDLLPAVGGPSAGVFFSTRMVITYLKAAAAFWTLTIIIPLFGQFSFLLSRLADRFQGLLSLLIFVLCFWGALRFSTLVAPLFRWLPDIAVDTVYTSNNIAYWMTFHVGTAPLAGLAIFVAGVFAGCAWLIEKEVEV